MTIEAAAEKLVDEGLGLSGEQVAGLAAATRRSMGWRPAALGGLRSSTALQAASAAVKASGRQSLLETGAAGLNEALLGAVSALALSEGRDVSGIRPAWDEFGLAVRSGGVKERSKALRAFRRVLRKGLGRPLEKQWIMAGIGARWALMAVVSWDLAGPGSSYTTAQREELATPWTAVATLPAPFG